MHDSIRFIRECNILRNGHILERLAEEGAPDLDEHFRDFIDFALEQPFSSSERLCLKFALSLWDEGFDISLYELKGIVHDRETLDLMAHYIRR